MVLILTFVALSTPGFKWKTKRVHFYRSFSIFKNNFIKWNHVAPMFRYIFTMKYTGKNTY